jgi:hypothetical protein
MNFANYLLFKINEEKFNQLNKFLIDELKLHKQQLVEKIGEMCVNRYVTDEMILSERKRLQQIDDILDKLEYNPKWLFEIDFDQILEAMGKKYISDRKTLEEKINDLFK